MSRTGLALVVVVGPKSRFQDREVARLRAFMERGGPLLVLMDGSQRTGLEDLLALHNVAIDPGMVVDPGTPTSRGGRTWSLTPPLRRVPSIRSSSPSRARACSCRTRRRLQDHRGGTAEVKASGRRPLIRGCSMPRSSETGPTSWADIRPRLRPPDVQPRERPAGAGPGRDRGECPAGRSRGRRSKPRMVVLSSALPRDEPLS